MYSVSTSWLASEKSFGPLGYAVVNKPSDGFESMQAHDQEVLHLCCNLLLWRTEFHKHTGFDELICQIFSSIFFFLIMHRKTRIICLTNFQTVTCCFVLSQKPDSGWKRAVWLLVRRFHFNKTSLLIFQADWLELLLEWWWCLYTFPFFFR